MRFVGPPAPAALSDAGEMLSVVRDCGVVELVLAVPLQLPQDCSIDASAYAAVVGEEDGALVEQDVVVGTEAEDVLNDVRTVVRPTESTDVRSSAYAPPSTSSRVPHLMPDSEERTHRAIDEAWSAITVPSDTASGG